MGINLAMQQWVEKRNFSFTAAPDNYDKGLSPFISTPGNSGKVVTKQG
jgi:hypothetical protein